MAVFVKYLPMLRNRLFAIASFASLVAVGGVVSIPAALADELSLNQATPLSGELTIDTFL